MIPKCLAKRSHLLVFSGVCDGTVITVTVLDTAPGRWHEEWDQQHNRGIPEGFHNRMMLLKQHAMHNEFYG